MKILLATDGSRSSKTAVKELIERSWPSGAEVRVISVVHPFSFMSDGVLIDPYHAKVWDPERKRALHEVRKLQRKFPNTSMHCEYRVKF